MSAIQPMLAEAMDVVSIIFWGIIIGAMVFGSYFGYGMLKRWMNDDDTSPAIGFTLGDLRELHRQGKMTDAEYEKARSKMVGAAKKAAEAMPDVLPGGRRQPPAGR